ncbi:transglutaminase-like domain-containing protein [Zhenpiania hominis]|uniref:Transglutaminase domain-containing protein n=1 Tax=Zhenpiania hominis TaxID=2763644 RepID=A0A923NNL7_9FIRM|nr:transglutaminase-like domain-containing protein [Zhenpiania hominis]MBC6679880.1 transglutaminase domain-containing protein [Zhenpiania hominis]
MKHTGLTKLLSAAAVIFLMTAFCACQNSGEKGISSYRDLDYPLFSETPEKNTIKNEAAEIDISNTSQGYIGIRYLGNNRKVKLQLTKDAETYTYNIQKKKSFSIFPLSMGNGTYTIGIFENISTNQYSQACSETIEVKLEDENLPFLYPNEYVSYTRNSPVIRLSNQITEGSGDELEKVEKVFDYVTSTIDYDYELAENIPLEYIPDIEQVLKEKTGICFDYASVMSAMLRIQGIPTRLVIGYAGDVYHAWISVYVEDKGWVDGIIRFDGESWTLMDPTTAASSGLTDEITDDSLYNALYYY